MTPLPEGFGLNLDRSVRTFRNGTVLIGGHPGRLITLSPQGVAALGSLLAGRAATDRARLLGRRLVDAGMAHPRSAPMEESTSSEDVGAGRASLTVVVPVHNRSEALDRCLGSLGTKVPVVVVDDASDDPDAVARVCKRHRARLIRRNANGGPAAARNEALESVATDLVAFVDSDCLATDGWLGQLVWIFEDTEVGAIAPRIRPARSARKAGRRPLTRFADAHSALDMGPEPSDVAPHRPVRYVPAAALIVRREAVAAAAGFDSDLRVGEDVDLVWRLIDAGWRVRYEPSTTVFHEEPSTWARTFARRFRYGTSAGPLSKRHPGRLGMVELRPWPTVAALALLTGRRRAALAVLAASAAVTAARVRGQGIPLQLIARWSAAATGWTMIGMGRAATTMAGPALAVGLLRGGRARLASATLVLGPAVVEWRRRRPDLDPIRWSLASIVDDIAYGAGVWAGCLRSRSFGPMVPRAPRNRAPRTVHDC